MEKNKEKIAKRVAEKKLNGCAELYETEDKGEKEIKRTLTEISKAIETVEELLNAG